jgi:hypothetical protein
MGSFKPGSSHQIADLMTPYMQNASRATSEVQKSSLQSPVRQQKAFSHAEENHRIHWYVFVNETMEETSHSLSGPRQGNYYMKESPF